METQKHEWLNYMLNELNLNIKVLNFNPYTQLDELIKNNRIIYRELKNDHIFVIPIEQLLLPNDEVFLIDYYGKFKLIQAKFTNNPLSEYEAEILIINNFGIKSNIKVVNTNDNVLCIDFRTDMNDIIEIGSNNKEVFLNNAVDSSVKILHDKTYIKENERIIFSVEGDYFSFMFGLRNNTEKLLTYVTSTGNKIGPTTSELKSLLPFLVSFHSTKHFMNIKYCDIWFRTLFGKKIPIDSISE